MTIDMKNFAGVTEDSAAEDQVAISNQHYQEDYPIHQELLEKPAEDATALEGTPQTAQVEAEQPNDKDYNFKALREEIASLKQQKDDLEANFRLMRSAQLDRPAVRQEETPVQQKRLLDHMSDDDIPNVADIRSAWEQREVEYMSRINELQVAQSHPDYEEVIEKYTIPLLNQKPHLAAALQDPRTRVSVAYDLGKLAQQQQIQAAPVQQQTAPSVVAQKIVENARKPGTLSSAGGQSILSKADYYATMSDQEFAEIAKRNLSLI